ncbi:cobalt-precorrin-5B (C(1))-methyltransferase CbiD [Marinivivus vitaminiproducens]|uniref:cobalt-precorrin-5B (C(1))-methyltransferase CbiD n=1 Tax=Marinivivus vitaminiproducens TaxID=3035935 RepID=UPI0027A48BB6|nr:cobalt-precorrin-5B (C(1))-methyltransferase CbiD [Geminicoccaceae bacterium SCSIO 64248]
MTRKPSGKSRRGWTAGSCATAAAKAAYVGLLTGRFPDPVSIRTPYGDMISMALSEKARLRGGALAAVARDVADAHDMTDGALIRVAVRRLPAGSGVLFVAGEGVGVVTRPDLAIALGEPAIDRASRAMIREAVADVAAAFGDPGDVEITVSIPGGAEIAARTVDPRSGLVGGLAIPGEDHAARGWSGAAWAAAILRRIDVARRRGVSHVVVATDAAAQTAMGGIGDLAGLDVINLGGFVGGAFGYLRRHPVDQLTLGGGCVELAAIACGHLDPSAERMRHDLGDFALLLAEQGVPAAVSAAAREADTEVQVMAMARHHGLDLGGLIARRACTVVVDRTGAAFPVEVVAFDRESALVGRSCAG